MQLSRKYKFLYSISKKQIKCVLKKRKLPSVTPDQIDPETVYLFFDKKIIGYYMVTNEPYDNRLSIDRFEIFEKFKKQGHGSYMLGCILQSNPGRLFVLIPQDNDAMSFFEKRGFVVINPNGSKDIEMHLHT